jgi:hypothetical protein
MSQDKSSFKKVAALTGLTVLVGGAEISSAATLIQDPSFGPLSGPSSSTTLNFNQFNPSFGNLSSVEIVLTSQIFEAVGTNVNAHVSGQGINATTFDSLSVSPTNFNAGPLFPSIAAFIGVGTLPYGFQYSAACGEGLQPACGEGWSGDLKITYTYSQVPLPAALPLFATGLTGLGVMGWVRRLKQKAKKQA